MPLKVYSHMHLYSLYYDILYALMNSLIRNINCAFLFHSHSAFSYKASTK